MINNGSDHSSVLRPANVCRAGANRDAGSAPPLCNDSGSQEKFGWRVIQTTGSPKRAFHDGLKIKPHMDHGPKTRSWRVQAKTGYRLIGVDIRVSMTAGRDLSPDSGEVGEVITRATW